MRKFKYLWDYLSRREEYCELTKNCQSGGVSESSIVIGLGLEKVEKGDGSQNSHYN